MLWENDEKNCGHEDCGEHCLSCMKTDVFDRKVRVNQEVSYDESRGLAIGDDRKKEQSDLAEFYRDKNFLKMQSEKSMQQLIRVLSEFRKANIEYINRYFDKVLAVSGRVAEIVINAGIRKNKVQVSYIGTKVADHQCGGPKREYNGGTIHLCYLGFMRKMKGFYFLLEAMENMPEDMARKVSFTFATEITDESVRDRLKALESKFETIHMIGGYSHEELPEILKEVDLGVVPPLWEDNLPQVAMEFKAYGVPVLCSDLGGAAELAGDKAFVFQAGDTVDFICKLSYLMEHPEMMASYWNGTDRLVTLGEHMREMTGLYSDISDSRKKCFQ
jgi:glycosyltransferase involved in cell wall biosynthesis